MPAAHGRTKPADQLTHLRQSTMWQSFLRVVSVLQYWVKTTVGCNIWGMSGSVPGYFSKWIPAAQQIVFQASKRNACNFNSAIMVVCLSVHLSVLIQSTLPLHDNCLIFKKWLTHDQWSISSWPKVDGVNFWKPRTVIFQYIPTFTHLVQWSWRIRISSLSKSLPCGPKQLWHYHRCQNGNHRDLYLGEEVKVWGCQIK